MKKIIILVLISAATTLVSCNKKQAYIDIPSMLNQFDYYEELEKSYSSKQIEVKTYLDSLLFDIKKMEAISSIDPQKYQSKVEEYYKEKEEKIRALEGLELDNERKINNRVNIFLKEYGESNNYEFIYAANGSGNLLYADTTLNITDEFVKYANLKYAGYE